MKHIILLFLILSTLTSALSQDMDELREYLETNWKTPEEYVISKFTNHDYIFIGEYHRIKHDVDLILKLIPLLHKNGINILAIEFGRYENQHLVDSLLRLPYFDRDFARQIMFGFSPTWAYKEYIDIYEVAWQVNYLNNFDENSFFRIISLMTRYDPCKDGGAWKDIDPDEYMAEILIKEVISNNQKALIYCGRHHSFTKYHQPLYDFKNNVLVGFTRNRMGNIIYDTFGEKAFYITLHAPWVPTDGWDKPYVLPVNGTIDRVMDSFNCKRVGFDLEGSPFGELTTSDSYFAFGYVDFTLKDFADGYIFQYAIRDYMPITMETSYYNRKKIKELKRYLSCRGSPKTLNWILFTFTANKVMHEDIRKHFKHLM
jgi:hypothetical protein